MMIKCCGIAIVIFECFIIIAADRVLYEGDECEMENYEIGVCTQLPECPGAIIKLIENEQPINCGFVGSTPIVCCEKEKLEPQKSHLSEQKCKSFKQGKIGPALGPPSSQLVDQGFFTSSPINIQSNQGQNFENSNFQTSFTADNGKQNVHSNYNNMPFQPNNQEGSFQTSFLPENSNFHNNFKRDKNLNSRQPNPIFKRQSFPINSGGNTFNNVPLQQNIPTTGEVHTPQEFKKQFNSDDNKFIIGGVNAKSREFPHMAALGYTNGKNIEWLCGGSLVSDQFVLTAGHCLFSREYGGLEWARLGDLDLVSTADESNPIDYRVVERIAHPQYKPPSVYHDIAVVKLNKPVRFNSYVRPACLFVEDRIPPGFDVIATGWGLTQVGGKRSDILQKVNLDLFTEEECDNTYKNIASTRKLKVGIQHDQQFCVGGKTKEVDTCQGDSGGPLQIKVNDGSDSSYYIIGITSFGKSCGYINVPGVYIRVSYYVPWLESILWPNES